MINFVERRQPIDAQEFARLVQLHLPGFYKAAWVYLKNDEDVADAVGEAILTAYEKIDMLQEPQYFKTWMTRIVVNKCLDMLRKRRRMQPEWDVEEQGYEEQGYQECEWKQLVSVLNPKYQDVVTLFYGQRCSVAEISEILDLNANTVRTRLSRAREQLRRMYETGGRQYEG